MESRSDIALHCVFPVDPSVDLPCGHESQVALPSFAWNVSAGQFAHVPSRTLIFPFAQGEQNVFPETELFLVPRPVVHFLHAVAVSISEYIPDVHSLHFVLPFLFSNFPAGHSRQLT